MKKDRLTSYLLIVLSIITISYSFIKQVEVNNKEKELSQQIEEKVKSAVTDSLNKPSEYPDYSSLSSLNKLILAQNFESWTPKAQKIPDKIIETIILERGSLAKGYVYIKASINDSALTRWESIFMTMNYHGGHIFRPQSLSVPTSNKTELLYALDDIPYLTTIPYNEQSVPAKTNWFGLFSNGNKITVTAFISSLKPSMIEELTIYYLCDLNNECSLSKSD